LSKTSSAKKAARTSARKKLRNKAIMSATKTHIAHAEKLAQSNDAEAAKKEMAIAISVLDKAAKKKVIHPNTAARRKSRLTKKFNKATSAGTGAAKSAGKSTPKTRRKKAD
jgi:small subunit ribosomal protein S20